MDYNYIDISIVIPTRNRKVLLAKTLEFFNHQTYPRDRFEVIVADDGSDDGAAEVAGELSHKLLYRLNYFRTAKAGPASARNKAVRAASAKIILFTGDDIFPKEDLIERHLESHRRYPDMAVLGFVDWAKEGFAVTDFMRYLSPDGFQFKYGNIKDNSDCGFRHFYTANISLNKKWFKEDMFDEEFSSAILEDTELGYRLEKKGLKILYNPLAIGYHHHSLNFESFCQRMKLFGFYGTLLAKKHPELRFKLLPLGGVFPSSVLNGLRMASWMARINQKLYWRASLFTSYVDGIKQGLERGKLGT